MLEDLSLMPAWYLPFTVFIFGVIIGSFLNVVLCRLHTGKSLAGHSHCLSCGQRLRAYDLVPLLSYLILRGRCRTCSSYIPVRYFGVELLTGLLFLLVALNATDLVQGTLLLAVMAVLVLITVYDLQHFIIPDELVVGLLVLALLMQGYGWASSLVVVETIIYNFGAAALGSVFLYALWAYSKGRWIGFGDVKLAFPLGLMVGYGGVFSFLTLAFWVGAVVGLVLLGLSRWRGQTGLRFWGRRLTIKSAVPFAPFMIAGFLLTLFLGIDVIALFTYGY